MSSRILAVLLAALVLPAAAHAQAPNSHELVRGTTGHGKVVIVGTPPDECETPATTPTGTAADCAVIDVARFHTCQQGTSFCRVTIRAVAPAGWAFTRWRSGPCIALTADTCTFADQQTICDAHENCEIDPLGGWHAVADFVDSQRPVVSLRGGPANGSVVVGDARTQSIPFGTDEDDGLPALKCARDGAAAQDCASPDVRTGVADGIHSLCVTAKDRSGNESTAPACVTWQQETVPTATLLTVPPAATTATGAAFTYTSNKIAHVADGSTLSFECKLDARPFEPCLAAGQGYSGLGDGTHTFSVQAVLHAQLDPPLARHVSAAATRAWTIDTTPPETTIASGPADGSTIVDVAPTLTFSASEPAAFTCRIDGGAAAPCTSPFTTPPLASGPHRIEIAATDAVGNADPTPAVRTFTLATGLATLVDADHDGFPESLDCDDHAAGTHPGATEIPGNGVDENCDAVKAPFPLVAANAVLAALFERTATRLKSLKLSDLKAGDTVAVSCTGHGCRRSMRATLSVDRKTPALDISRRVRGVRLKKGAVVEVRVTHPGFIARIIRFTVKRYRDVPARSVLCQAPGATRPGRCSGSR